MPSDLTILQASHLHSRTIWEWRNDPTTRSVSRSSAFVTWHDHQVWFDNVMQDPFTYLYVGCFKHLSLTQPVGVIRFSLIDQENHFYEVSLNVSPSLRGKGLGRRLLSMGTSTFVSAVQNCSRILAEVKSTNINSNLLFQSSGYSLYDSSNEGFTTYFLDFS